MSKPDFIIIPIKTLGMTTVMCLIIAASFMGIAFRMQQSEGVFLVCAAVGGLFAFLACRSGMSFFRAIAAFCRTVFGR